MSGQLPEDCGRFVPVTSPIERLADLGYTSCVPRATKARCSSSEQGPSSLPVTGTAQFVTRPQEQGRLWLRRGGGVRQQTRLVDPAKMSKRNRLKIPCFYGPG